MGVKPGVSRYGKNADEVFENRVQRRIFGAKRDEVTGGWRKLHNEELHNSYFSPNMMKEDDIGVVCGAHGGRVEIRSRFCW
jgi:hypothetical protein